MWKENRTYGLRSKWGYGAIRLSLYSISIHVDASHLNHRKASATHSKPRFRVLFVMKEGAKHIKG